MGNEASKVIQQAKIHQTATYGNRNQRLIQSKALDQQDRKSHKKENLNVQNHPKPDQVQREKNEKSEKRVINGLKPKVLLEKEAQKQQILQRVSVKQNDQFPITKKSEQKIFKQEQKSNEKLQYLKNQEKPLFDPQMAYFIQEKKLTNNIKVELNILEMQDELNSVDLKKEEQQPPKNYLKNKKNQVIEIYNLISSEDDQKMKDEKAHQEISSEPEEEEYMLDEEEQAQNQPSEMLEEESEEKDKKRVKKQVKLETQQNIKLKNQYYQKRPEDLGIFQWNELQDLTHLQLDEEVALLFEFENQVKEKGKIQSPYLLSKIKQKIYLKSIDALATGFNTVYFTELQDMKQCEGVIKVGLRKEKKCKEMFGQLWQVNVDQDEEEPAMNFFGRENNQNSNSNRSQLPKKQNLELHFSIDDLTVGSSRLITNINERYQKFQQRQNMFYESLDFLLKNQILQVETVKISESPYKGIDANQVYLNTRASQSVQNLTLWRKKMEADYEITIPLTLNLVNYYNYVCKQKLKEPPKEEIQNVFGSFFAQNIPENGLNGLPFTIRYYTNILRIVSIHIKTVINFIKKSKRQQQIKNQISKVRLESSNPSEIQAPQEKNDLENQQSDQDYDIDAQMTNLNPNNNRISDQQVSKEDLEKLFESGNWFSLHSSKIQPRNPSFFFKGELKQYQQLTLAWMLFRQNCKINYHLDRPHEHFKWQSFSHIGEPQLFMNTETNQILNFIPYWKKKVKGGMLCDEMGLGKTVMSLALIDSHVRRQKKNPMNEVGTLIIVPTNVLTQWEAKINQFLPHMPYKVIGQAKDLKKEEILKSEIVITTFGVVLSQSKKQKKYQHDKNAEPTLYDFDWFRVIIDEADNLRNHKTLSAKMIQGISKKYIWLLTGTPIQNKLSDLQSYFNLLEYKHHGLLKAVTKKGFIKSDKSLKLIKESLKDIMVRRKKDTLDENGKPILDLKECKWIYYKIEFTPQEKEIYDYLSGHIAKAIEKIIDEDREQEQWDEKKQRLNRKLDPSIQDEIQHIFGKLMKLRQFCCHPELLFSKSTFIKYENFAKHFKHFCQNGYDINTFKNFSSDKKKQEKEIFRKIFLDSNQIQRQMHKSRVYQKIMSRDTLICTYCQEGIKLGIVAPCLHLYCQDCFQELWVASDKKNREKFVLGPNVIRSRKFMFCYDQNCNERIFNRQTLQLPRFNRFNKKLEDIEPNRKIYELLKLIEQSQPHEKIVIYSHFIGMIEILEETFRKEMIPALRLVGRDSISERTQKLKAFREKEEIKVLVISTKCGYAGLNLQFTNKIFFMDPWWNPAVEDQAMGRLHRYGQENEVEATRFIIEGSIEEIINLMGNQKKLLSDFVLDSDCSKKRRKKFELLKFFRQVLDRKLKNI